jgi:hypothetical protein
VGVIVGAMVGSEGNVGIATLPVPAPVPVVSVRRSQPAKNVTNPMASSVDAKVVVSRFISVLSIDPAR